MGYEDLLRISQEINMKFKIFTVANIRTCSSWVGTEDHPAERCVFLGCKAFGTRFTCQFITKNLKINEKTGLILPDKECPLWKKIKKS